MSSVLTALKRISEANEAAKILQAEFDKRKAELKEAQKLSSKDKLAILEELYNQNPTVNNVPALIYPIDGQGLLGRVAVDIIGYSSSNEAEDYTFARDEFTEALEQLLKAKIAYIKFCMDKYKNGDPYALVDLRIDTSKLSKIYDF